MKFNKPSQPKFVAATVVMIVMAIVASRQLYLFVSFRNADGLLSTPGDRYYLWLVTGAIVVACLAACLMFLFFPGRGRSKKYEVLQPPLEPQPPRINIDPDASLQTTNFSATSWAQDNEFCVEGQADDRRPMNGSVSASLGSASAKRSSARLNHQEMFRKWARERHD